MASLPQQKELRLVLLGRSGAGKRATGNTIMGRQNVLAQAVIEPAVAPECEKQRGIIAGRLVSVVDAQDWFCSERPPEEVKRHLSSCVALSTPGPHAFLLCVPVDRPADLELQVLDTLEKVLGPTAVSGHTLILFTHKDRLGPGEQLDEYIARRKDLLELVVMCGDRFHFLESRRGEKEERRSVEELLDKVEQVVKESGREFYRCPLYEEAEARVREKQAELVTQRRQREGKKLDEAVMDDEEMANIRKKPVIDDEEMANIREEPVIDDEELSNIRKKPVIDDEEMANIREEAERSVCDLNIDMDTISCVSPASTPPSFLLSLWQGLTGWLRWLPKMLRMEALLGAFIGLFVGGSAGRMLGATVGSVATEVGRRKTLKTEQKNK